MDNKNLFISVSSPNLNFNTSRTLETGPQVNAQERFYSVSMGVEVQVTNSTCCCFHHCCFFVSLNFASNLCSLALFLIVLLICVPWLCSYLFSLFLFLSYVLICVPYLCSLAMFLFVFLIMFCSLAMFLFVLRICVP